MKNMNKKTKIAILLISIIIVVGIVITFTMGLNFDLKYQNTQKIELDIKKEFEISDIKQITDEVLGQEALIQKVEIYEDSISIRAKEISEEQKTNIINKVNEKYGTELKTEEIKIQNIPNTKGRDIIKPYIVPFVIATLIVLSYMAIRYHKLGKLKTILKTALVLIISQAMLLSVMAIARIKVGCLTIPLVLVVYTISLIGITLNCEKQLKEINEQEE